MFKFGTAHAFLMSIFSGWSFDDTLKLTNFNSTVLDFKNALWMCKFFKIAKDEVYEELLEAQNQLEIAELLEKKELENIKTKYQEKINKK